MITKYQAEAIVKATHYRDWTIETLDPGALALGQLLGAVQVEFAHALPVKFTYEAPDSRPGVDEPTTVVVVVAVPLTPTEAQFARALFEAIGIMEEHERREFFSVDLGVIKDRPYERHQAIDLRGWDTSRSGGQKETLFHPHGINRNKLFHDLDDFASELTLKTMDDSVLTADAV